MWGGGTCVCVWGGHLLSLRKHFKHSIRQQQIECLEQWKDNSVVLDIITEHFNEGCGE